MSNKSKYNVVRFALVGRSITDAFRRAVRDFGHHDDTQWD